jgi:predicted RecB family nuclease
MAIPIDRRRSTHYPENVTLLKEYVDRIRKLSETAKPTKPKERPVEPEAPKAAPAPIDTDLTNLPQITKKIVDTLVAAGITSIHALSTTSPRRIARLTDIKRERAEKLVETAKRHIREEARAIREEKAQKPKITELKHLPDISRDDLRKLKDLGVTTLNELKSENTRDLSLLTGIPESRIKGWIKIIRALPKASE